MNDLSQFLVKSILDDEVTANNDYPTVTEETIHLSKEVIEEWALTRLPSLLKEASKTGGFLEVDDGPNFFFRDFRVFDKVSRRRAEQIGYEVVKQIMDATFQDLTVYPEYPNGPIKAVTPFPAGVIGKVTATNQKDFATDRAYDLWSRHVRRVATIVGYTLVREKDKIERRLAVGNLDDIYDDETAKEPSSVNESTFFTKTELEEITNDIMSELGGLMIGYAGKDDIEKKQKQLKKLRKKLDKTTPNYPAIKEEYDRLEYYLEYYKNLTPSTFTVNKDNNNIVISLGELNERVIKLPSSLGIPRNKMPQISANNVGEYISFLKSNGIKVSGIKVDVSSLKMTQSGIDTNKVNRLVADKDMKTLTKPVIISKDGYVLDGHHRVAALYNLDSSFKLNVVQVHLPIRKLLDISFKFPKVFTKNITEQLDEATSSLKLNIPQSVRKIHSAFKKSGKKLYVVGGAVRDAILGKSPKDFDLTTDAKPDEVIEIAKKNGLRYTEVGKAFGVVVIDDMEIATFRVDIGKGRRPDAVEYTDIYGDVKRRDLTINALFYDLDRNEIVDLVGGIKDLQKNRIRTVGNAIERFDEDPLRKLRAIRFAARLGGKLDKGTLEAIKGDPTLRGVSEERIRDEFIKSIQSAKSVKSYLKLMDETKLLHQCFPNMVWKSSDFIEEKNHILLIAYLFRRITPTSLYKQLMKLKYSHDEANGVKFLIQLSDFNPKDVFLMKKLQENVILSDADIIRWGKLIGFDLTKFVRFRLSVKGDDVMKLGFSGKDIGVQISKMEADKYINENKEITEAPIYIHPGLKLIAQNTIDGVKEDWWYIVKKVEGAIGNLTYYLQPLNSKKDMVTVRAKSPAEFYAKVMKK